MVACALGNPLPTRPHWELRVGPYVSILISELCALVGGTLILAYNTPLRSWDAARVLFIALAVSYVLGVIIWTAGFLEGILVANPRYLYPANPFLLVNASLPLLGVAILMLPEFLGTAVGTTIIRMRLATPWTRALAAMAFAMAISIVVNMLIISLSLA
jgi:hypothetical protein